MRVGFIGLGIMGSSMALNLRKGGFDVLVHDLRRAAAAPHLTAGCAWAESPAALASEVDIVLTSLPGPREVEAVADGLLEAMRPGAPWFDLSTNSPTVMRRLHARFAARGLPVLDAPVSGGPAGAKSGRLALWVGGERAVFDQYRNVLDAIGDQARFIGPIGAGSVAKLVHNAAGYAVWCALAEVFTMGVKAGVEPLTLWSAIRQGALGRARTFDRMADQFLQARYEPPDFALALARGSDAPHRADSCGTRGSGQSRLGREGFANLHVLAVRARKSGDQGTGGRDSGRGRARRLTKLPGQAAQTRGLAPHSRPENHSHGCAVRRNALAETQLKPVPALA